MKTEYIVTGYIFLILSILFEVFSTQMMKVSEGFTKLFPSIAFVVGMGSCFYIFSKTLAILPLGVAYAIWAGLGTALTAILAVILWKETMSMQMIIGIVFIIIGVILLNLRH